MPATTSTRSYIGKGPIYARKKSGGLGLLPIGNCSALSFAITEDVKSLADFTNAGGGTKDTLRRITKVEGSLDARDFSPENLALALRGELTAETAGSVAAEAHTAYTSAFVALDHLLDKDAAITPVIAVSAARVDTTAYALGDTILASAVVYQCTVAGTSGGSAPTYATTLGATTTDGTVTWTSRGAVTMVADTDYQIGNAGILILSTASRFALGLPITVAYTKNAAEIVQALVNSATDYELFFDGLNEVDSGNPSPLKVHRVQFGVTAGLPLIADDFGTLQIKFDVLQDTTISGTGISQYFKVMQVAE
jgi:hypothetical protein